VRSFICMQAMIAKGEISGVGPMLKPLLADWEGAVTEKHVSVLCGS